MTDFLDDASEKQFDKAMPFKKDSILFAEGEPSSYLYLIKSGKIRIFKEHNERVKSLSLLGERDIVGELSMFDDSKRVASAIVEEDAEIVIFKKSDIKKVIKSCDGWVSDLMVTLADRLKHAVHILHEHRLEEEFSLENENYLTPEKEFELRQNLEDYRGRRGLKL